MRLKMSIVFCWAVLFCAFMWNIYALSPQMCRVMLQVILHIIVIASYSDSVIWSPMGKSFILVGSSQFSLCLYTAATQRRSGLDAESSKHCCSESSQRFPNSWTESDSLLSPLQTFVCLFCFSKRPSEIVPFQVFSLRASSLWGENPEEEYASV